MKIVHSDRTRAGRAAADNGSAAASARDIAGAKFLEAQAKGEPDVYAWSASRRSTRCSTATAATSSAKTGT
jgi:hypothetical protein